MPTIIKGQPTSAEIRKRLKAEGRPVVLSCPMTRGSATACAPATTRTVEPASPSTAS